MGLGMMGGRPLSEALQAVDDPGVELAIVLENDLFRRAGEAEVERFLELCGHVVVVDHSDTRTTAAAEVVLPAATFAESTGTLINSEPRAQRFYQVFVPAGDVRESWRWLQDVEVALGDIGREAWHSVDDVLRDLSPHIPDAGPRLERRSAGGVPHAGDEDPAPVRAVQWPHRHARRPDALRAPSPRRP